MKVMCVILATAVLLGCGADYQDFDESDIPPPPRTSTTEQALSGCYQANGLHMNCVYGSSTMTCWGRGAEGACYCPEPTPQEWRYCTSRDNCSRPEYSKYCSGACPNGTPVFVHWCVSGQMPWQ